MSLEGYRERVRRLARARDGEPIYNGSLDHAAIIVEEMFSHATRDVSILTGELNARVYGPDEVVEAARLFLADSETRVRVMLEEKNNEAAGRHPFRHAFADHPHVEFRYVPPQIQETYKFHFMVMDDDSYRFEQDKNQPAAIAAFGDPDGAGSMRHVFGMIWDKSEKL